jgi:hypothetical protein
MSEDTMSFAQLVTLAMLGAAPALLLGLLAQLRYALRKGWALPGQRWFLAGLLGLTLVLGVALTLLGWVLLPDWFLHLLPSATGMVPSVLTILALPSAIAVALALFLSRWAVAHLAPRQVSSGRL